MKILITVFGLFGGFALGAFLSNHIIGGVIGALVGSYIGNSIGITAVKKEAKALSGKGKSTSKAIFWWFVLLIIATIILVSLGR